MAEEEKEAFLKLKILNGENLKTTKFLGKIKSFFVLWIDPRFKQSTKTMASSTKNPAWNYHLSLPLSLQTLKNPNSRLTIQIISPSSPIQHQRIIGWTILPIADIPFDEQVFTLQLWRPSGKEHGLIRVSCKVEINLGFYSQAGIVTGVPVEPNFVELPPPPPPPLMVDRFVPSAPPEVDHLIQMQPKDDLVDSVETSEVKLPSLDLDQMDRVETKSNSSSALVVESVPGDGSNALRSLLIGFLGGAVAVATVLVGSTNN